MDGDALAQRDVAHDLVAGDRLAALGHAHHDVAHALDGDAELARRGAGQRSRRWTRWAAWRPRAPRPFAAAALQDLVDHGAHGDAAGAEGDVQVFGLLVANVLDDPREDLGREELLRRQALATQRLLQQVAARVLGVFALLAAEVLAHLLPGPRRRDDAQPVARRPAARALVMISTMSPEFSLCAAARCGR